MVQGHRSVTICKALRCVGRFRLPMMEWRIRSGIAIVRPFLRRCFRVTLLHGAIDPAGGADETFT